MFHSKGKNHRSIGRGLLLAAPMAGLLAGVAAVPAEARVAPSPISRLWLSAERVTYTGPCRDGYPVNSQGKRIGLKFTLSVEVSRAPVTLTYRLFAPGRRWPLHTVDFDLEGGGQRKADTSRPLIHRSVRTVTAVVHHPGGTHYSNSVQVSVRCVSLADDQVLNPV